jgi:translation initiation factor 3 subunit C
MLINKIKEESLRIYLITSAICFSNISIPALTDMFQLPIKSVYSIISKMIINQELIVGKISCE